MHQHRPGIATEAGNPSEMNVLPWHQAEFGRFVLARDKMPHALLIRGRRGTGKHLFAQALAQALLCEKPPATGAACGRCPSCGWMESAAHPDFRMLEPAAAAEDDGSGAGAERKKSSQQITIDQVRELADFVNLSSHRGGHRLVVIHPAEALNVSAANALLKNLEEPPVGVGFILVAHRAHHLLPTIVSRCRQAILPDPDPAEAAAWLHAQGIKDAALALAQAGNSPLLARQHAGDDYWQQREFLLRRIADPAFDPLQAAEQIRDYPVPDVVGWLQKWTFDLFLSKCNCGVRYNPDYGTEIAALAAHADTVQVVRFHRSTIGLQRIIHHPLNARLLFEQLLIDYAALLQRDGARQA